MSTKNTQSRDIITEIISNSNACCYDSLSKHEQEIIAANLLESNEIVGDNNVFNSKSVTSEIVRASALYLKLKNSDCKESARVATEILSRSLLNDIVKSITLYYKRDIEKLIKGQS